MGDHWSKTFEFLQHPFFEWLLSFAWVQWVYDRAYAPAIQTWGFWPTMYGILSVIVVVVASGWAVIKYVGRQYKTSERKFFKFWQFKEQYQQERKENNVEQPNEVANATQDNSTDNSTHVDVGDGSNVSQENNQNKGEVGNVSGNGAGFGLITGGTVTITHYHGGQQPKSEYKDDENAPQDEMTDNDFQKKCDKVKLSGPEIFSLTTDGDGEITVDQLKQAMSAIDVPETCVGKNPNDYYTWFKELLNQLNSRGETSIYRLLVIISSKPFSKEFVKPWIEKIEKKAKSF